MAIAAAGVVAAVGVVAVVGAMAVATATADMSVPVAGGPRAVFAFAAGNNRPDTQAIVKTTIRCVGPGAPDFLLRPRLTAARKKEPRKGPGL